MVSVGIGNLTSQTAFKVDIAGSNPAGGTTFSQVRGYGP